MPDNDVSKKEMIEQHAIEAALCGNWENAIKLNTILLKEDKNNIGVLNRLGFAYLRSGELTKAVKTYQRVLKIDPYNQIALKNNSKLSVVRKKDIVKNANRELSPMDFLEEPGKTKIASCVNLATNQIISSLTPGQEVFLKPKNHTVEVRTDSNEYIAALPDDISFKLIKLMASGNRYQVVIKGTTKNTLLVVIREMSRGKRFANQPTFLASGAMFIPYTKGDGKDSEKPDVSATGEEDPDINSPGDSL